jgi:D-alanyl-D-alanine-carboxypeptidase/D-alanyl-D-alanine-endopeptidase
MKQRICNILFAMSIGVAAFGQTIQRLDGTSLPADSLANQIVELMKAANVSGVAISVFNHNQPVFSRAFGLADVPGRVPLRDTTVLYGASESKLVFAYVVMQLVQEKILDLDKPLVSYLDSPLVAYQLPGKWAGYRELAGDERYTKITARMCLDHTTGFPNWRFFEADQKLRIKTDPGTRYRYSGEGLMLLQFVIEKITGKDYETIAQERVFKPLGMPNSSYIWQTRFEGNIAYGHNAKGEPYPLARRHKPGAAGSMSTTLSDFTRFYTTLIGGKVLSPGAFNEMTRAQVTILSVKQFGPKSEVDSTSNNAIKLGYGLGVGVFQTPYGRAFFKEGHDDGWGHYTVCFPDKQIAIVIFTNNDNGESIFKPLLAYAIGDSFTPWYWENYIPYDQKK